MIVRATAYPAQYLHRPLRPAIAPQRGLAPLSPPDRDLDADGDADATRWGGLDDAGDAALPLDQEGARADRELLRCAACAAFATLVLALVSSLQLN